MNPKKELLFVNNRDFYLDINVITFFRDIGKKFSLAKMVGRDTVKRRL